MIAVLVIPFSLSWVTYNPLVQTFIARMAASYLTDKLNTLVKIDGLYITPRLNLNMNGVLVLDQRTDTLFNAEEVFMDMKRFRVSGKQKLFSINDISIKTASFKLLKGRNDSVFSYDFIRDHFESESTDPSTDTIHGVTEWRVSLRGLDLDDVRFRYINENMEPKEIGMDYNNLDIFVDLLHMHDLAIHNDTFDFRIEHLAATDKCGFVLDKLQGDFQLSPLFLIADSLHINTPASEIKLDLGFHYDGWPSYLYFTEEVEMRSMIYPSELNMRDIGYFAPDLLAMNNRLRIGGKVKGKVNNLRVSDFRFTYGENTRFYGDVRLYGLPDVVETYIHTSIDEFVMNASDIRRFAIPGSQRYISVPDELEAFGEMRIEGSFTGFYNDFVSTAEFASDIGTISTDVSLKQNEDHTDVVYTGAVKAKNFHIGKFLHLDKYFGTMDLDAMVSGSGLTGNTVQINIHGGIDSLGFMGNTFNQLGIGGEIAENKFNGHLDVEDDMIEMAFDGILDFEQSIPLFDFTADIKNADLFNLNMIDRDSVSLLSAKLKCNFIGLDFDDLDGRVYIDSLKYIEGDKALNMQQLALINLKDTGYSKRVMLSSDFLDANIKGRFTYTEMTEAINGLISRQFENWSFRDTIHPPYRRQVLDFNLLVKDTREITDIFYPGLMVQPNSTISGKFDSRNDAVGLKANIPSISYSGIRSDLVIFDMSSNIHQIKFDLGTERLMLKEKEMGDTLELGLENFKLGGIVAMDSLNFYLGWDDHDVVQHNRADLKGYYTYVDSIYSELVITGADVLINDSVWTIDDNNRLLLGPNYFSFQDLAFKGNDQVLALNGVVSNDPQDTLRVDFANWKLSNFDIVYANYNFDLNGVINGYFGINDIYGSPNFFSDLAMNGLEMNDVMIGDAIIHSRWNEIRESIDILSEVIYHGNVGDSKVISLIGSYYPSRKNENLDFLLKIDNLRLSPLERFAQDYISQLNGVCTGSLRIQGSADEPELTGDLRLMRTGCRVNYLNTPYSFSHTIDFTKTAIQIADMQIYDSLGQIATVNGEIRHENLRDLYFDLTVNPDNFICLQTNRYQNQTFYGTGIASGEVKFYGPVNDFHIDADVSTTKGTDIVIPLNNSITVTDNDFVIFVHEAEEEEEDFLQDYSVELKGLSLDFNIEINNTADLMIWLPANLGNISSKGFGDIRFTINPRGEFKIYGDYNFLRGTFFFSFQNVINRRFEILQGGDLRFTGNPYNADVNLKALYKLKTSLSGLGANISPELEGQRVNVNSFLMLRGKLANPEIKFSIDFPNVREEEKQTIFAVLDTNDVVLMGQQMMSLLLMNSFSYASTSASMGASSLNIISSQISNWLSQISSDFDVGINYRAGDEITQDEIEVALSTQFFDNRLIVDGNVGVITKDNTQQQASNIVGDVNIEYKLRPDGRVRLKAYNRSNNFNSIDYNSPYTQGFGVRVTKEFDNFRELFKRQKRKKSELQEPEIQQ